MRGHFCQQPRLTITFRQSASLCSEAGQKMSDQNKERRDLYARTVAKYWPERRYRFASGQKAVSRFTTNNGPRPNVVKGACYPANRAVATSVSAHSCPQDSAKFWSKIA